MRYSIVLHPEAEQAIDEAAEWYGRDNDRIASIFVDAVDHTIERVAENPYQFPVRRGKLRHAIVSGFPYSVLYRVTDSSVVITNCLHFSRDPSHWR